MTEEPLSVELARRRLNELTASLAVYEAAANLAGIYQEEVEEIAAFLAAYEAGDLTEPGSEDV